MGRFGFRLGVSISFSAALLVLGCGGGSGSSNPPPPVFPQGAEVVFLEEETTTPGQPAVTLGFILPITNTSVPKVVPNLKFFPAGEDANGNFVALNGGTGPGPITNIVVFKGPLTDPPAPFATVTAPTNNPGQVAFDSAGDLFVNDSGGSLVFWGVSPLTSGPLIRQIGARTLTDAQGVVIDANDNVIIRDNSLSPQLIVVAPPYLGAPIAVTPLGGIYSGTLIIGNQLFMMKRTGVGGNEAIQIDVFNLPLSATSQPAFSITGLADGVEMGRDQAGNLYVLDDLRNLLVYNPPFSAASSPSVRIDIRALPQTPANYFPDGFFVAH